MQNNDLDYFSEKILKLFLKEGRLNTSQLEIILHKHIFDFSGYLVNLLKRKYIRNTDLSCPDDDVVRMSATYQITTEGKIYFDFKKQAKRKYILQSVLTPIALSFVTALITTIVTNYLKK